MPLTKLHILTGGAASAGYFSLDRGLRGKDFDAETLAESFVLGAVAGSLPDVLEPPLNRRHRKFFHSMFTLGAAAAGFSRIDKNDALDDEEKAFLKGLLVAYMSHLAMDSRTRKGIPLLF